MKTYRVFMSELVFYHVEIEVADEATDEEIEAAAEEQFVQGHYQESGQDDRQVIEWEETA